MNQNIAGDRSKPPAIPRFIAGPADDQRRVGLQVVMPLEPPSWVIEADLLSRMD
jgi:hypothetical protein